MTIKFSLKNGYAKITKKIIEKQLVMNDEPWQILKHAKELL